MVMHARKLPRLDDGYTDKRESHPYQTSQYPSKTYSYGGERYDRQRSPGRADTSPSRGSPRYSNKSSYIDRAKEKYERGNTGSPGKKANHVYPGSSSNHSNNGHHSNNQDRTAASTSRTNSSANAASNAAKDNKGDVQKSAIRSCGDWSEHLSSTGKKYYYNCRSEVSQWEKPREWNDGSTNRHSTESKPVDKYKETKNRHSSGPQSLEKREKHLGDLRHMVADSNPKPDKLYLFEKLQESQSKLQAEIRANMAANKPLYALDHPKESYRDNRRDTANVDGPSRRSRRDSDGPRGVSRQGSRQDQNDDLDVSPDSTPTSLRSTNCVGTPQIPTASTPGSYMHPSMIGSVGTVPTPNLNISSIPGLLTELSGGQNNQELTNQALVTLKKLQQALSRQIIAQQSSVATQQSTASQHQSSSSVLSPRQLPPHHHHLQPEEVPPSSYVQHQPPGLAVPSHLMHAAALQHLSHSQPYNPNIHKHPYSTHNSIPHSQLSPQPPHSATVSMVTESTTIPIVTASPTIPITHSSGGNQLYPHLKANTVYGKLMGSQNRTPPNFPHMSEDGRSAGGGYVDTRTEYGAEINRSMCCSPTPSDTSSQGMAVDPEMFSAATNAQHEEKKDTMTNLRQYYNENLVGHVTGWQAEHVERQARAVWEESLKIGSLLCSQVSVELKRSRSLVRVEEIQATLNEQRNLFLAQQVHELESIKPVSSFLSSS